jgi:UDP-2,4-diacetamido-2,4,6-trideoxy-beta-L-altropyranose hydrolase
MAPFVIFRADAAPALGGGHVQRCLALAETLIEAGWRTGFAFRGETLKTVPALAASPHRLLPLEGAEKDEVAQLSANVGGRCDLLVVDHYGRGVDFEMAGRQLGGRIMVIEDRPGRRHDCDLLLDPTPGREAADYRDLVPNGCTLLLGPSYALLSPQFAKVRAAALSRSRRAVPKRIFVSMGMTDPRNFTEPVLQGIAAGSAGLSVDVVIGSAAPHLAGLRRLIDNLKLDARLHLDADNVAELMGAADLAVGAAGSSSFERCCLGLPSLVVVVADNQRDIAAGLDGAAELLGLDDLAGAVAAGIKRLCADANVRVAMAKAAAALCDGRGAARVAGELLTPAQA